MRCDCNHGGNLIILLLRFDGIFRDYLGFSSKPERKINKNKTEIIEKRGSGFSSNGPQNQ